MTESVARRTNRLEKLDAEAIRKLLEAVVDDLGTLRADVAALDTALDAMATKLNADAGVTDVDYAGAAALTSTTANLID